MKRSGIKSKGHRKPQLHGGWWPDTRDVLIRRAHDRCEGCQALLVGPGWHAHHRRLRSAGGEDCPCTLLVTCSSCHSQIHASPRRAMLVGRIVSRYGPPPAEVPILIDGLWWLLNCDGSRTETGAPSPVFIDT